MHPTTFPLGLDDRALDPGPHLPGLPPAPLILGSWNSSANLRGSIIHMRVSPQIPTPILISSYRLATSSWVPHKVPKPRNLSSLTFAHTCPHSGPLPNPVSALTFPVTSLSQNSVSPLLHTLWPCHRAFAQSPFLSPLT